MEQMTPTQIDAVNAQILSNSPKSSQREEQEIKNAPLSLVRVQEEVMEAIPARPQTQGMTATQISESAKMLPIVLLDQDGDENEDGAGQEIKYGLIVEDVGKVTADNAGFPISISLKRMDSSGTEVMNYSPMKLVAIVISMIEDGAIKLNHPYFPTLLQELGKQGIKFKATDGAKLEDEKYEEFLSKSE